MQNKNGDKQKPKTVPNKSDEPGKSAQQNKQQQKWSNETPMNQSKKK